MLTPEQRNRHLLGKRLLRRQRLEQRTQRERRQAEIAIEREWARRLGLRAEDRQAAERRREP